ncbi:cytoplasmic dynein 2 heavy chain 1 [Pieris brassicae]|uniref:cytoplasmic dynein 2 heavy chain 1 n=1 Tax=Pieris brassicae TaxID=7116 RepID=UPI001E661D30|nr:cytoplasmic dynein 2 heavy chain 1 [Pieris brassicae]
MTEIRDFFFATTESFYKSTLTLDETYEEILMEFIHNSQILLIQTSVNDTSLVLYTKIQPGVKKSIIFYKTVAQSLSEENALNNINIITLTTSAEESLYQILRQIYCPLLATGDDLYSNKLQNNLFELESNLRILTHGKGDSNINVILSVSDEVEYWKTISELRDTSKKEREAATSFCVLFEDIFEEIRTLHSGNMQEIRDCAENIAGILDDIWRYTPVVYTQERMIHIFDIIGHALCTVIQNSVTKLDIWKAYDGLLDNHVLVLLSESLNAVQMWVSACQSLTGTYWPNYALHTWKGKTYVPIFCVNFQNRLREVHNIRSTYNQLSKLLTKAEKSELNADQLFEPFKNINIWICNGPMQSWDAAVAKFSANLRPAETKIAEKLKPRLHNTSTKQMLYEFTRYKTLINRPMIKNALNNELELFVASLLAMLNNIRGQLDSDDIDVKMYQPPEMSPTVQQVQWAKQMEAKVKEIQECVDNSLTEFEKSKEVSHLASQMLTDLKTLYTQLHEDWCRDLQAQVKNGSLQLSVDKPVVEFSSATRLMEVNFNPRLVNIELEARSLCALGLPSPPAANVLDKLTIALRYARALQQVASFHNTLGERMIPSTRPMMLEAALDLSALVQSQKPVFWNDEEQLAAYTENLKKMVLKLESQNSHLTSQHLAIRGIVEKLMDTELLAKQSEWKKSVHDIRDIIEKVESNGFKNTEMWRSHWEIQVYKAMECQYIRALLSLHSNFPLMRVDLVLRGRAVTVQPPLEQVRTQLYQQLRRLVSLPSHFPSLLNNQLDKAVFASIVEKHGWIGNKAVHQIESALSRLSQACETWSVRACVACAPDLDALCADLIEPEHWEMNFKACKAYGQAVAKMSFDDEKIEWISVGTISLRREFEAQSRNLWACLMTSLQNGCHSDASLLDTFIANATVLLENKTMPKNAKELADISAKQQALREKIPEMEKLVEGLKRKSHMLRTWGGDSSIESVVKEWFKMREQMNAHLQMFERQAEVVKSSLTGDWDNITSGVEAWVSRWGRAKARLEETRQIRFEDILDRCRSVFEAIDNFDRLVVERDELVCECKKFNMEFEVNDVWKEAESLRNDFVKTWNILKEYNDEYETIGGQEWIVFQKKLHLLEEFVCRWKNRLEPYTAVTLYMQQEIDKYTDLTAVLKYIRGTEFTERHWCEVFNLLEMEYRKPETLQLNDFLKVAVNIKKQMRALQKISSSAASEAAVRTALNELELWFAGARLTLTYYTDKAKKLTPIVKDFKDILTKVEEQQWVVWSLGGELGGNWDNMMRTATTLLKAMHHVQRRWLYLEPILLYDEGDLGVKFRKVDLGFKHVARIVETDPRLSALIQSSRLQPMLDSISEQLNACQSALNQYIDEKRTIFPRLYFLSDDDLLELLGQARSGAEGREAVLQTHLKKLFPGITGVVLGPDGVSITTLCSHYDETFELNRPVDIDCAVENWLKNLENEIRSSLKSLTLTCISGNTSLDLFSLPTQIMCLAQNIRFTEQTEKAITSKELRILKDDIEKENESYASDFEDEAEKFKKQAMILQCAYYKEVVAALIENNVVSTSDWVWQKQLRFYLIKGEVVARMGLAEIPYSYEYLGIQTGQFVRTELAEECFLILTQSLHFGFIGNPFGPAGTGKTESVKALGGLVGRLVLIFNCDEAMDGECMGRLLTGLALSGAWGCFDEFNRLSSPTLASVSHQFTSILAAMLEKDKDALLNGKQVCVSPWCGIAVTLNPVGRGYGGRRELPSALQRVLRPVALTTPTPGPLASHLLAAHGASHPTRLAADLTSVFTLSSNLLSSQRHYDWGLRALKAAVGSCGQGLRARGVREELAQRAILRKVLKLNNLSKLTKPDADRFENILSLVFADVPEEELVQNSFSVSVQSAFEPLYIVYNQLQAEKCMELYEQLQQRMGVVIVGPPGSGKTSIRKLLKNALISSGRTVMEHVIYPKAVHRESLLGHVDHDTRQWTDGVISAIALQVSQQPPDVHSWVVCDGDIDPEWIEALNSVLDDNRLLTLPSGWRVQFGQNVNFIFETHSLEHASPATISRMGIILLSEEECCVQEVLQNWMREAESDEMLKGATALIQSVVQRCLKWFDSHKSSTLQFYRISMVQQIFTQLEYVAQETDNKHLSMEEVVYSSLQQSVIGLLKENAVHVFHEEMSDILGPPPQTTTHLCERVSDVLIMSPRLNAPAQTLRAVVNARSHAVIMGYEACAKYALAEFVLRETNATIVPIDCSPLLEPADIISELKRNNVVRSAGGSNSRVVVLVRALHRARVDAWGSSPVHSFLLQLIQGNGFWSSDENGSQWHSITRVSVIATAEPRANIASRLAAALAHIYIPEPTEEEQLELVTSSLKENVTKNFGDDDVLMSAKKILSMFKEITEKFDAKPHYTWNSSHLKTLCENIKWYSLATSADLVAALNSQAKMIFRDRLLTDEEKADFDALIHKYLDVEKDMNYKMLLRGDGVHLEGIDYAAWYQNTLNLINQCLTEDEKAFGDGGMEICKELSTLCPSIALALNGNVVTCVSGTGSGACAAARIVCAALSANYVLAELPAQFANNFKASLTSASEGNHTLLMITEWSSDENNLAIIEAYIRAGTVYSLPANVMPSIGQNAEQTLINIKQNLGILICLHKDQKNLSELLEKFPFMSNTGRLIWLERWSEATLREMPALVVQRLIKEDGEGILRDEQIDIPLEGMISIYNSLEEQLKSPYRYMHFIKAFYNIVTKKKTTLVQRQRMLSAGVEALRRARSDVGALQAQAAEQELELNDKREKANKALEQIGATVRANTDKHEEMQTLKKNIETENEKLQIRKQEIEEELAGVQPVIAAARAAVGDIKPESLSEMRSLRAPPDVVRDVLEGVLRLMGIADTSWHSMKSFLSKRGVKEDIRCLDASHISPEAIESVQRLLEKRGASFEQATARRASAACAPLAAWVHANLAHAQALLRVKPLQAQQRHLHKNLQQAESELEVLSSGMTSVEERVMSLKEQLGQHTRDAAALEMRLTTVTDTIQHANGLLQHLANEYRTWETDLQNISREISELNQRSLLAAAYVVFLPDLTETQAEVQVKKWCQLLGYETKSFSVISFLSSPEKQVKWEADGLPLDQSALKNAVLIDQILDSRKCGLTPLIIDPDGEAINWLKKTLNGATFELVSQNSDKLQTAVQYAIRLNRTLVVYDVECVHASWWGGGVKGNVLLVTRDPTLVRSLPAYVLAVLSPLYFTARLHALFDQLIHYTMQKQNPEMNEKIKEMKLKKALLQNQLHELQENLLKDLSSNSDILHDANLKASLNKTRDASITISESLSAAQSIEEEFKASCKVFEESALKAAHLLLAVKELAAKKPLVSVPIDTMLDAYVDAVRRSPDVKNISCNEAVKYLMRRAVERVLLSLHKKDKYSVVLHLLKQVFEEVIPEKLWQLFIGSFEPIDDREIAAIKNVHHWIPDDCLKRVASIKMEDEALFDKLSLNDTLWLDFMKSGDFRLMNKLGLTIFETVVAVSALRPNSLYRAVILLVDQMLGAGVMSGGDEIRKVHRWSSPQRCVLLLGTHAADQLQAHAYPRRFIQLGIDEGRQAWEGALESIREGGWLAIIVGASPFSRALREFLNDLKNRPVEDFNSDVRVWIVAEDREVPAAISGSCVNVLLEAAEGVKHNVCSVLSTWSNSQNAAMTRRLVNLAILHALVLERRAYVPLGWSRYYEWGWGEVSLVRACVSQSTDTSRSLCEAVYSARVPTAPDRRVLRALVASSLGDSSQANTYTLPGLNAPLPYADSLQDYITALENLPELDSPELLGLAKNCRLAWERKAAENIVSGLREMNSTVSKRNTSTAPIKSLLVLWKKLMTGNPLLKPDFSVEMRGSDWWTCVCAGESSDAKRSARVIHHTLAAYAHRLHTDTHLHIVPEEWQMLWSGPDKPDEYIREFCFRARASANRLTEIVADNFMPKHLDLRSLLFPARALRAVQANAAATLGCAPHSLRLDVQWDHREYEERSNSVKVTGLSLSGCRWDVSGLCPVDAHAPPFLPAPPLSLTYVPRDDELQSRASRTSRVTLAMYASATRDALVCEVSAPLAPNFTPQNAILHAAALFIAPVD